MANGAEQDGVAGGLTLTQITPRIAVVSFPTDGSDGTYRSGIRSVSDRLKHHCPEHYRIFNVSQKRSDLGRANAAGTVMELGWPGQLAPPLDRLCLICKQIETWLSEDYRNIAVIHCKGWVCRAAMVLSAYMHYAMNVGNSEESVADKLSLQLFSDKLLSQEGQPSHSRYIAYFANLLSGVIRVNQAPLFLTRISFTRMLTGKRVVVKIYEKMKPVWTSAEIELKDGCRVDVAGQTAGGLSLRGDVLFKCFLQQGLAVGSKKGAKNGKNRRQISPQLSGVESGGDGRLLLFQCQFNTCTMGDDGRRGRLVFHKEELDLIYAERGVDNRAAVEMSFIMECPRSSSNEAYVSGNGSIRNNKLSASEKRGKSPSPGGVLASAGWLRVNSYENFYRSAEGGWTWEGSQLV